MPPPYNVQCEVDRRNPARVDAMNEMYMQMYTMSAEAQRPLPLSALLRIMNIDGKDRLLPVIEASEAQYDQMAQMQAQMEQMQAQIDQLNNENANLKTTSMQATNALANIGASQGGFTESPNGGGMIPIDQSVSQMRQNILARESSM